MMTHLIKNGRSGEILDVKWYHIALIGLIASITIGVILYIQNGFMPFVHTLLIILSIGAIIKCYDDRN